jgi:hypothetical protein
MISCRNDDFSTSSNIVLEFSADTLRLDTVFTARGSATYILKVFNPSDENVMVESIKLLHDTRFFRLNVDGLNANEVNDIPIYANDSMYIFCEVTIDPDQPLSVSPFIIHDRIEFITNGNQQIVHLEAWGQNANYFPGSSNKARVSLLTCNNGEVLWDDEKPYVIYGVVFIDSCALRVMAGTRIYVHGGPVSNDLGVYNDGILFTLPNGKMRLEGTIENPIVIQDDRLEPAFENVSGQWSGLRFGPLSRGNTVRHTIIKNCVVGIQMDSLAEANLHNVEIYNTTGSGIVSVYADLDITNSLIHNNGGSSISVLHGGVARIKYCTLSNFGNQSTALNLTNFRCYDALCSSSDVKTLNAQVFNSILIGDDTDEISLVDGTSMTAGDFNYLIDHCLYKANKLPEDIPDFLSNCVSCVEYNSNEALFVDRLDEDFHLDSLSQVEGLAKPIAIAREDKDENTRDLIAPDMGCYEYVNP